jgi:hypothetical protein
VIEPPPPLSAISLVDLIQVYRQHNAMRAALRLLSETIEMAGCRPDATAAMRAMIQRVLGE